MKIKSIITTITILSFSSILSIAQIPADAARILSSLEKDENKALSKMEKTLIDNKKEASKKLLKIKEQLKGGKGRFVINKIDEQLRKYEREIAELEEASKVDKEEENDDKGSKNKVVSFDKSYYYRHPMDAHKNQIGEMVFYENGKVTIIHRVGENEVYRATWKWAQKGSKLEITGDGFHCPIDVIRKNARELTLHWHGKINKINKARIK